MIRNQMTLEFMSCSENVGLARVAVATFASGVDFNLSDLEEIKVAVSEAVSNAVIHGYEGIPDGIVRLSASLADGVLEIVVEDTGKGIVDLEQAMLPGTGSDSERLGLGFVFMKTFMDDLDVWTEIGKGTRVKMLKSLPARESGTASREME
jgi:stage II sporulation protein AB (anti-sigma F factor)